MFMYTYLYIRINLEIYSSYLHVMACYMKFITNENYTRRNYSYNMRVHTN